MDDNETYTVTCGTMLGVLHMNRFLCPGINQECIEVSGNFVSPKTFSIMGDKGKLKNWKNAVRINGKNIRKLMDTGELDFFNHAEICTGKCMSRGVGMSKYDVPRLSDGSLGMDLAPMGGFSSGLDDGMSEGNSSLDGSPSQPVFPGQSRFIPSPSPNPTPSSSPTPPLSMKVSRKRTASPFPEHVTIKEEPRDDGSYDTNSTKTIAFPNIAGKNVGLPGQLPQGGQLPPGAIPIHVPNGQPPVGQFIMTPNGLIQLQPMMSAPVTKYATAASNSAVKVIEPETFKSILDLPDDVDVMEDSQMFWRGILQVGLIDDFFREIKYGLDALKHELIRSRGAADECQRASRIVNQLGLVNKLKLKISAHKTDTEKQKNKLDIELEVLRRRMQEAEQKQEQLNRKTNCFQSLIDASRPNKMARVDSPSPSVSPVPHSVSKATTNNTATPATSSITVVTRRDADTGKPTVIIPTPTRSSRKSSNPTKAVEEPGSSSDDAQSNSTASVNIRRSSRSRKPTKFSEYARGNSTESNPNSDNES